MDVLRRSSLLISLLFGFVPLTSQSQSVSPTWIYFRDKDQSLSTGPTEEVAERLGVSKRALWRRAKVLPSENLLDVHDLPIRPNYRRQLEVLGLKIRATSRWMNAVSVEATSEQLRQIQTLGIAARTAPVARLQRPPVTISPVPQVPLLRKRSSLLELDYGPSGVQLSNIRVVDVHARGIDGSGVIVGMIDDGFNNHRSHNALKNIRILDEFDFIHRITSTQRQPWEVPSQGNHGALTLSALAGFENGKLIGAAYSATLILAKTEMDSTEVPAEEDLYVEALEWMELLGADVVSTSLGYIDWYTYDSLNGTTAITSKAAGVAARKGVLLVTAMGNEGHFRAPGLTGTLIAPADADSIISAGATFSDGEIVSFSSTGPTADGRVKPEVVAQGVSVVSANGTTTTEYVGASGTSLSTPLVAGSAALVFSANPDLTPMQVREALLNTAFRIDDRFDPSRSASYPNNFYGHGMVDAFRALTYHGIAMLNQPMVLAQEETLSVYTSALSDTTLLPDSLFLFYQSGPGASFERVSLLPTGVADWYSASVPEGSDSMYPKGYLSVQDSKGRVRTNPKDAPGNLLSFRQLIVSSVPGATPVPKDFVLQPNYPNPFNGETTILFQAPAVVPFEIHVYDVLGRRIRTLLTGLSTVGTNVTRWDGTTDDRKRVSSGVYFYRLQTPQFTLTRAMLFLQ
ncbi:MAG: S8 family peptidase [Ignavibacteriales bacterium]|nr:S8 family peptidase [Ignavibacteriales bacterium]